MSGESLHALLPPPGPVRPGPADRLFTGDALQRAWLAIKRAGGGPGVDGANLADFEARLPLELGRLREELVDGRYRPRPLRQVLIPKPGGGIRPLVLWAVRDRVAQRLLYDIMTPAFEPVFLPCSFGFRPGLGVEDATRRVQAHRDAGLRWIAGADIANCFDEISPERLLPLVARRVQHPLLLRYVRGWLEARIFNSADGLPARAGASQGSALSPLLANIYLHQIDVRLTEQRWSLVRYADDFVICCRRREQAETALSVAATELQGCGLRLSEHKSRVVHFDQGFAWLGHFFIRQECHRLS